MAPGHGVVVSFPGEGKLYTVYEPGKSLAWFRDRLEEAFLATYSREVEVEALLHPTFLPDEVALPLNDDSDALKNCLSAVGRGPNVVAKFQYRNPQLEQAPRANAHTLPRKRRFDRRYGARALPQTSSEEEEGQNLLPPQMPRMMPMLPPQSHSPHEQQGEPASYPEDEEEEEPASFPEDEEEATYAPEDEEEDFTLRDSPEEDEDSEETFAEQLGATLSSGRSLHSGWRHHRSAMQSKALGSVEEVDEEFEMQEQEQEVDNVLRREQVYLPSGLQPLDGRRMDVYLPSGVDGRRLEVLHESQEEDDEEEEEDAGRVMDSRQEDESPDEMEDELFREAPRRFSRSSNMVDIIEEEDEEDEEEEELEEEEVESEDDEDSAEEFREAVPERGNFEYDYEDEELLEEELLEEELEEEFEEEEELEVPRVFRVSRHAQTPLEEILQPERPLEEETMPLRAPDDLADLSFSDEEPEVADNRFKARFVKGKGKGKLKGKGKGKGKGKDGFWFPKAPEPFEPRELGKEDRKVPVNPGAFHPELKEKAELNVRMQRIIRKEIEKKRSDSPHRKNPKQRKKVENVLAVLQGFGYAENDVVQLLEECKYDMERVQRRVDSIIEEKSPAEWTTVITGKNQREWVKKERAMDELSYLEANFGQLLQDLQDDRSSDDEPEVTPEQAGGSWKKISAAKQKPQKEKKDFKTPEKAPKSTFSTKPAEKLEELRRQWLARDERREAREKAGAAAPEEHVPEETTIHMMNRMECRNLLMRMKPLAHPPAALYEVLAKRAVQEYIKFRPRNFYDCQDVTFWQFSNRSERECPAAVVRPRGGFAGTQFFDVLSLDDSVLLKRIPQMNPICVIYMLYTMQQSGNVSHALFGEAGRYVAEHVSKLDRDSLGKLAFVFAAARVNVPGVFHVVAQEVNRRSNMREGEHSLSPRVLQDLFFAFGRSKIYHKDCMEYLMLRTVALFDADVTKSIIDAEYCAPTTSAVGRLHYEQPFSMQGLVIMLRGLSDMKLRDKEFFEDVAEFTKYCLEQSPEVVDRFIGDVALSVPQMAAVYVKADMHHSERVWDLFSQLEEIMLDKGGFAAGKSGGIAAIDVKDNVADKIQWMNTQGFRKNLQMQREVQKKEERRLDRLRVEGGERRRGGMGRGFVKETPEEPKVLRRDLARDFRDRLKEMTAKEEAAAVASVESSHVSTAVLMSGFKTEALLGQKEPQREGRPKKSFRPGAIKEASLNISNRNMPKGNKEEVRIYPKAKIKKKG